MLNGSDNDFPDLSKRRCILLMNESVTKVAFKKIIYRVLFIFDAHRKWTKKSFSETLRASIKALISTVSHAESNFIKKC